MKSYEQKVYELCDIGQSPEKIFGRQRAILVTKDRKHHPIFLAKGVTSPWFKNYRAAKQWADNVVATDDKWMIFYFEGEYDR